MIKTFLMALLICTVLGRVIWQQNHVPLRLNLTNKINATKIDDKEINLIEIKEKKWIHYENMQSKKVASVEVDHEAIQTNADILDTSSTHFVLDDREYIPITTDEHFSTTSQKKRLISPDAVWNARKFIITTPVINHNIQDNTKEVEQNSQSENENDISVEPDKVHCPLVKKIQQAAPKMNEAFLYNGTYGIVSHDPVFQDSNLLWIVGAKGIAADSSDEAIYMARIAISKTNLYKNEYAEKLDDSWTSGGLFTMFACYYSPGDIMAVGLWDKMFVDE